MIFIQCFSSSAFRAISRFRNEEKNYNKFPKRHASRALVAAECFRIRNVVDGFINFCVFITNHRPVDIFLSNFDAKPLIDDFTPQLREDDRRLLTTKLPRGESSDGTVL